MIVLKHIIFSFSFFCFFMLNWQSAPHANSEAFFEPSSALKVASMFYKLSNATPDFTKWAKETVPYLEAHNFDKEPVLKQQEIKLREVFYNTFKDQKLNIEIDLNLGNYSAIQEKLFLEEFTDDTFFSYVLFGDHYAVIVPNIKDYQIHEISNQEMDNFNDNKSKRSSAIAEIEVTPISANNISPLDIDGQNYWVIIGELSGLTIWNTNRTNILLSSRSQPKDQNEKLLDLYAK